jgi:hypothetical protein
LVEHEEGFDWDEHDLREFYHYKNNNQLRQYSAPITETWLLSDNAVLMITIEITNDERILNLIISKEKNPLYPINPPWVDPNR